MVTPMFTHFRLDGWPLCPHCGADGLWSDYWWEGTGAKPPVQRYIEAGMTCDQCGWHHGVLPAPGDRRAPALPDVLTATATAVRQTHTTLLEALLAHDAALTAPERRAGVQALEALARAYVLLGRLGASETFDEEGTP
jgi:hypothetical protein